MRLTWTLLALLGTASAALADDPAALWSALRDGVRVALVRRTDAPGGAGDPPGFVLGICATQRNLSEQGRAEASALGERFRTAKIPVGKVLTSRWCRSRDTASLMNTGLVEEERTFDYAYAELNRPRAGELTARPTAVIAASKGPGALVVVTHGSNINLLTGTDPGQGGIVVVEPDPKSDKQFRMLGRIPPGS